jgi:hypothetical protein
LVLDEQKSQLILSPLSPICPAKIPNEDDTFPAKKSIAVSVQLMHLGCLSIASKDFT